MGRYAANTEVSVERSQAELRKILARYGAEGFLFGEFKNQAAIQFGIRGRVVKFALDLPDPADDRFTKTPSRGRLREQRAAEAEWEKACRQKWRALCLFVRSTLEAIEEGVIDFEDAFMPFTVLSGGQTVGERYRKDVAGWLSAGEAPRRLQIGGPGGER